MEDSEFSEIVFNLKSDDPEVVAEAAENLQARSTREDAPKLLELLNDPDFVIREAAAWSLSDFAGPEVLPNLLSALQRGYDEGLDNDGLQSAISDLVMMNKESSKAKLHLMAEGADEIMREHIKWLLEFCE